MKSSIKWVILSGLMALAAGCSTPESRIKQNPALFASFPEDVQDNVRKGQIDLGYTPEMVRIALDEPQRHYSRKTSSGDSEVWSYTTTYTTTTRQRINTNLRVRTRDGSYQNVNDDIWADVSKDHEYEHLRVEFQDGRAIAIEQLERPDKP